MAIAGGRITPSEVVEAPQSSHVVAGPAVVVVVDAALVTIVEGYKQILAMRCVEM